MIYVYDMILNWMDKDRVYEFFEWEINDEIEHIKRIPLFKIKSNVFDDIINYDFKVDEEFLDKIHNLSEKYTTTNIIKHITMNDNLNNLFFNTIFFLYL